MRFKKLPGRKYISGFDTFIRHRLVSELSKKFSPATILDVGGEGALALFMPRTKIITANIKQADICYSGGRLPLDDNSFDLVVSLDTLEHLPKIMRKQFLMDLFRIAKKGVIVCAPFGTPDHIVHEKHLLDSGVLSGCDGNYLAEHVKFGLPTFTEISEMAACFSADTYFQGDFREIKPGGNRSNFPAYLTLLFQTLNNMVIDYLCDVKKYLKNSHCPYTNRFFMIAGKNDDGK